MQWMKYIEVTVEYLVTSLSHPFPKAQGSSLKKEQKDCKNQRFERTVTVSFGQNRTATFVNSQQLWSPV